MKFDWHQITDHEATVFTVDETGQQEDWIADSTPEWAEKIADALNEVEDKGKLT